MTLSRYFAFVALTITSLNCFAAPEPVDKTERKQVISAISELLTNNYVFPKTASNMNELIAGKLKQKSTAQFQILFNLLNN